MGILLPQYKNFKQEILLFEGLDDIAVTQIILPDPPDIRKIAGYNLPQEKQKFTRTALPYNLKGKPLDERTKFIDQEWDRRRNGYWFMNNGVMTYLTGTHYLYCNWNKIDIGYPKYRNTDAELFYHWKKAEDDDNCYGLIELTCRRQGKSYRVGVIVFDYITSHTNANGGMQSKTLMDVKKLFQKSVVQPWRKYPYFFQPVFDNTSFPKTELRFFTPAERGKESRMRLGEEMPELESLIDCQPSGELSYDGQKLHRYIADETGKTTDANIYDRWEVVKKCLENEGRVIGKSIQTSSVEEMEKQGGKFFKQIWDESDPSQIEEGGNGKTISGLWKHFLPAYRGMFYDAFGNCDEKKGRAKYEADRKQVEHDPRKLAAEKRKNPFTIKEAFRTDAKDCHFNPIIIQDRLDHYSMGNSDKQEGIFVWKDGIKDTIVEFKPTAKGQGRGFISRVLEDKDANRWMIDRGVRTPLNTTKFIAGGDPFKFNKTKGTRRSNGAGAVFGMHDTTIDPPGKDLSEWKTNRFVYTYEYRPATKNEYGEDMIMMCHYFGCKMFPEINVDFLLEYFEERGYGGYLLYRKDKKSGKIEKNAGGNTTNIIQEEIFREVELYIELHGNREIHDEYLQQCLDIEESMTDKDLFVACGYALLGAKSNHHAPKLEKIEVKKYLRKFSYKQ